MEQPWCACAHGVLIVAEMRKRIPDEGVEQIQGLAPVQRPAEIGSGILSETLHAGLAYRLPEQAVIMVRPAVNGFRRLSTPGLAVLGIEIPLSANRAAIRLKQHAVFAAHVPVEIFHAPLFFAGKQVSGFISVGQEVRAGGFAAGQA